jgi:hypothetical protein
MLPKSLSEKVSGLSALLLKPFWGAKVARIGFTLVMSLSGAHFAGAQTCDANSASILHPHGGTGLLFSKDCQTAYVLPPKQGFASLKDFLIHPNVSLCSAVQKLGATADTSVNILRILSEQLRVLSQKVKEQQKLFQSFSDRILQAQAESEKINGLLKKALSDIEPQEQELRELDRDIELCLALSEACDTLIEQAKHVREEIATYQKTVLQPLMASKTQSEEALNILLDERISLEKAFADQLQSISNLTQMSSQTRAKLMDLYRSYVGKPGLAATMRFELPWQQLVADYASANKETLLNVKNWVPVPLTHATLWGVIQRPSRDNTAQPYGPALLESQFEGMASSGIAGIGKSELQLDAPHPLSERAFGNVVLSLVAACTQGSNPSVESLAPYFSVNAIVSWKDEAHFSHNETPEFRNFNINFKHLAEKLGLPQKKQIELSTLRNLLDETTQDWFVPLQGDNALQFDKETLRQWKLELLDELLQKTAMPAGAKPEGLLPWEVNSTGVCNALYCQSDLWAVGVSDSIFGPSSAFDEFLVQHEGWQVRRFEKAQNSLRTATIPFVLK